MDSQKGAALVERLGPPLNFLPLKVAAERLLAKKDLGRIEPLRLLRVVAPRVYPANLCDVKMSSKRL